MTDVIGTIAQMVKDWNGNPDLLPPIEPKCDFCWEFTAPIRESDLNEYQFKGDPCCLLVAITNYRVSCLTPFNRTTGLRMLGTETHTFDFHVLKHDNVGINVYNEIDKHPLSESKWETILKPIADCVACDPLQFCSYLGFDMEVTNWTMNPKIDWLDMNYTGWTINVQLRLNNIG